MWVKGFMLKLITYLEKAMEIKSISMNIKMDKKMCDP